MGAKSPMYVPVKTPVNGWGGLRHKPAQDMVVSAQMLLMCYAMCNPAPAPGKRDKPDDALPRNLREWQDKAAKKVFDVETVWDVPGGMGAWFQDRKIPSDTANAKRHQKAYAPDASNLFYPAAPSPCGLLSREQRSLKTKSVLRSFLTCPSAKGPRTQDAGQEGGSGGLTHGIHADNSVFSQCRHCHGLRSYPRNASYSSFTCNARSRTAVKLLRGVGSPRDVGERHYAFLGGAETA